MTEQLMIGIDIDGVLADLSAAIVPLIERDYGVRVDKEKIVRWDYYTSIPGIDVKVMLDLMDEAWEAGTMPLEEPGLSQTLGRLKAGCFHRLILSSRTLPSHPAVVRWLHDQALPYDSLTLLGQGQNKFDFPVDILIDDRPHYADDIKKHPLKFLFLRDQPWNRECTDLPANAMRVDSVAEAVQCILENDGKYRQGR